MQGAAAGINSVGRSAAPLSPELATVVAQVTHRIAMSEAVGAVLHISAVTSVLCLAYLRLDHDQSADPDAREARERAVRESALEAFNALEVEPETFTKGATFGNIAMLYPVYVVAVMADIMLEIRAGWRTWYYVVRQRRIPLLVFYRRRHHLHLVAVSAAVSVAALFLFGVGAIVGWHWIENEAIQLATSAALLISLFVVVLTSVGSTWQQEKRLKKTCGKLTDMGMRRREEWQHRQARERHLFSKPEEGETTWGLPKRKGPASAKTVPPRPQATRQSSTLPAPRMGTAAKNTPAKTAPLARKPLPKKPPAAKVSPVKGPRGGA